MEFRISYFAIEHKIAAVRISIIASCTTAFGRYVSGKTALSENSDEPGLDSMPDALAAHHALIEKLIRGVCPCHLSLDPIQY